MNRKIILPLILIFLSAAKLSQAQSYVIEPVAGIEARSDTGDNGLATASGLSAPYGIVTDDSGNVYIGDQLNNRIQKVNKQGIISTVAGCDTCYTVRDSVSALKSYVGVPLGVAMTYSGILYIADFGDRRIRKVDKNGIITTIAGTGTGGFSGDGGKGDTAEISEPYGIAVDKYGNVYIADDFNYRVRKVDTNDIITTFAGNGTNADFGDGGPATNAGLWGPTGVAADNEGNVYISTARYVRKVDTNGIITTVAGNGTVGHTGDGGLATNAEIGDPFSVAVDDSDNLYIPEFYENYIRKIYPNDTIVTIAGDGVQAYSNYYGNPDTASMFFAEGIGTDAFGDVYFADDNQVRELSPCSPIVTTNPVSPICNGQSVTLSASGRNDYSWSPGASLNYDSTGLTVTASPKVTTTYSISGTVCYATASIVVTVDTLPNLQINPFPASICEGQTIQLIASGASSYLWIPSTGLSDTTGNSVIFDSTSSSTYFVTGTNSFGCSSTDTEKVTIILSPNKPSFQQKGDTLVSSSEHDNQWYRNDSILEGDTSQYLIINTTGYYFVNVANEVNGCSTSSDTEKVIPTGINQIAVNNGLLSIYPNPFSNEVIIKINSSLQNVSECSLQVTDVLGQTIYALSSLNYNNEIDLHNLPGGVYFLTVIDKDFRTVFPLVKQ